MRLPGGVYNFGSQNSRSTFDTAALFLKAVTGSSDVSGLIERDTERFASCPRNLMIDTERIRRQGICLGDTQEGIRTCLADYQVIPRQTG